MRIHVEHLPSGDWHAIDLDNYDGAPDSGPQIVGWGDSREEAIEALIERMREAVREAATRQ